MGIRRFSISRPYFAAVGQNFRILTRKGQTGSQYFADPQEDIVDSAVYRRTTAVEDRYGITITAAESASHDYDISAMETILAGDDAYDIIFAHSRAAFVYALNGACVNVHDIDAIHLDKPWWSKDITQSCDVGGKLYILDGDISADSVEKAMCMYFNKRIFDELGLDCELGFDPDDGFFPDEGFLVPLEEDFFTGFLSIS